jgi:hypothetical protein
VVGAGDPVNAADAEDPVAGGIAPWSAIDDCVSFDVVAHPESSVAVTATDTSAVNWRIPISFHCSRFWMLIVRGSVAGN